MKSCAIGTVSVRMNVDDSWIQRSPPAGSAGRADLRDSIPPVVGSGACTIPGLGRMQTIDLDTLDSVVGGGWWEEYVAKPARLVRDTIRENLPYPVGPEHPNPQLPGLPIRLPSSK